MTLIDTHRAIVIATSAAFAFGATIQSSGDARAELGGSMPAAQFNDASAQSTVRIRSIVDSGGTTINEYATRDGLIFAYTWQGPTMPDLARLLGPYAEPYRAKAATQLGEFGHLHASRVEQGDVIVESGGQMRSYVGRAWLPAAIPGGFSPADLR
jgi:hypothetical protein